MQCRFPVFRRKFHSGTARHLDKLRSQNLQYMYLSWPATKLCGRCSPIISGLAAKGGTKCYSFTLTISVILNILADFFTPPCRTPRAPQKPPYLSRFPRPIWGSAPKTKFYLPITWLEFWTIFGSTFGILTEGSSFNISQNRLETWQLQFDKLGKPPISVDATAILGISTEI